MYSGFSMNLAYPRGYDKAKLVKHYYVYGEPSKNKALIRITRSGVAFGDILWANTDIARFLPENWVPGYEFVGEIIALNISEHNRYTQAPKRFKIGQRVCALSMNGAYSQYIEFPIDRLIPIPDDISDDTACCLPLNYLSAWQMMFNVARLKKCSSNKQLVVVHSASGGVGTALLQLSKHFAIQTIGTTSTAKLSFVQEQANWAIDYTVHKNIYRYIQQMDINNTDAIFESRGFLTDIKNYNVLKSNGKMVIFGFLGDYFQGNLKNIVTFPIRLLQMYCSLQVPSIKLYTIRPRSKRYVVDLEKIINLASQKTIAPKVYEIIPLSEAMNAWELLESRQVIGKILLNPHSS